MRVNDQQLCARSLDFANIVAQLRELSMADRSRVAIDENQYDSPLTAVL